MQLGTGAAMTDNVIAFIGLRVLDAATGSTETAFSERILNSLGIVNGEVICMVAEEAA